MPAQRSMSPLYSIGLDFGTESVRAIVVDVSTGDVPGQSAHAYRHGVIDRQLPGAGAGENLPHDYALQHPADWLESAGIACKAALAQANVAPERVIGVGVDFT